MVNRARGEIPCHCRLRLELRSNNNWPLRTTRFRYVYRTDSCEDSKVRQRCASIWIGSWIHPQQSPQSCLLQCVNMSGGFRNSVLPGQSIFSPARSALESRSPGQRYEVLLPAGESDPAKARASRTGGRRYRRPATRSVPDLGGRTPRLRRI